jgi:hypothetical protein
LYHASPIANLNSILAHGLRVGADGFVHLATNQDTAIYCVHVRWHRYLRDAGIVVFRVNCTHMQLQPCDEDALFVEDCFTHAGDIPKDKVTFMMTTQVGRGHL